MSVTSTGIGFWAWGVDVHDAEMPYCKLACFWAFDEDWEWGLATDRWAEYEGAFIRGRKWKQEGQLPIGYSLIT